MFLLSLKNGSSDPTRNSFDKYYMTTVEIKDFDVIIDNKLFFDQAVKNKQESYKKLFEISRNDDYTTGNVSDYLYHQKYYKLIGSGYSRQTNTSIPQQINFAGKLKEEGDDAKMFFIA